MDVFVSGIVELAGSECTRLECSFLDGKRASNLGSTSTVDDSVVLDEISDDAECVV